MATFKSSNGGVFIQTLGANTRPRFVGCVDMDSLTASGGAIDTLIRCFKADGTGWEVKESTITPPEPVTTTITTLVEGTANLLEQARSGLANLFVLQREGGRADTFQNRARSFILERVRIGERTVSDVVMREEDNPSMMGFAISALPPLHSEYQKTTGRQSIAVAEAMNDIHFCGVGLNKGLVGVAVSDALTGSPSDKGDVFYTLNGGTTWTAMSNQPFAAAEDIASVTCFLVGRSTTRVIAARGTTDAGNPMEIAYTDDWGATAWSTVDVGSTNAQFAQGPHSLFAYDPYNIWLVAGAGYIYYSDDGGLTWTTQEAGVATSNDLHAIHFISDRVGYAVGEADTIIKTEDGGQSWTVTNDNTGVSAVLKTVAVLDGDNVWVGNDEGQLFFTEDAGDTWEERAFTGSGSGEVTSIEFLTSSYLFGFMSHNTTDPVGTIFFTIDGGYTWEPITTFTNAGINGIAVIDLNNIFFTGEIQGGTGVIGKVFPKP